MGGRRHEAVQRFDMHFSAWYCAGFLAGILGKDVWSALKKSWMVPKPTDERANADLFRTELLNLINQPHAHRGSRLRVVAGAIHRR